MYYYIVNPVAGSGRIGRLQQTLTARLHELGISGEFAKSLTPSEVTTLTTEAISKGAKTVVAVGGDGTLTEVIRAVYGHPGVAVGVIPIGERNRLASLFGIFDPLEAPAILAARKIEQIDLGEVGGRYFIGSVVVGESLEPEPEAGIGRRLRDLPSYLGSLKGRRPVEVSLTLDETVHLRVPALSVEISNSRMHWGSGSGLSDPQDHRLDVTVVSKVRPSKVLSQFPEYLSGRVGAIEEFSLFRAGQVDLTSSEPLPVTVDGERTGSTPITVRTAPQTVPVVVGRERSF
jgi:diacylglycerol kinase (ATP)